MATVRYLAMTASEFHANRTHPSNIGWMACHFSPYSSGLCDLPAHLPAGSMLILNDRIPIRGHHPAQIAEQLQSAVHAFRCSNVLLDFQHPDDPELEALARNLKDALPCPLAVSQQYAGAISCPVFLSPCPHHVPLADHIKPWSDRELWLDLAMDAEVMTLTESGATISPLPYPMPAPDSYEDRSLHCHYSMAGTEKSACFTFWRTRADLEALSQEAEELGISTFVGLYQEFYKSA